MPSATRRLNRARLHHSTLPSTASPTPSLPHQIPIGTQSHLLSLTNAELHVILQRRLRNDNLPDDPHTLFAERIASTVTALSSFCAKLYLLERTPLANLPATRPRLAFVLRLLAISQLRPLRILTLPLIRVFRPLSWLLAPFSTMAPPVTVHILTKYLIRQLTPTPPPRPRLVDTLVERAAEVCDMVSETVNRAREAIENDVQHFFDTPPPQLPALADIVPPPLSHFVASEQTSQSEHHQVSSNVPPAPSEEETVIRSPLPALRRTISPPGLSVLSGQSAGAGITVSSTARSQRALGSELGSEVGSDIAEEKSWWYKSAP